MPSWDIFDHQTQEYQDSVLPPSVKARVAVEQASSFRMGAVRRHRRQTHGMKTFGASAPLKELQTKFGFEPDHIVVASPRNCWVRVETTMPKQSTSRVSCPRLNAPARTCKSQMSIYDTVEGVRLLMIQQKKGTGIVGVPFCRSVPGERCARTTAPTATRGATSLTITPARVPIAGTRTAWLASAIGTSIFVLRWHFGMAKILF